MPEKKKSKERLLAEDVAREITKSRDERGEYRDEDAMIEDYRELREQIYWDEMDRRENDRGY